MMMPAHQSDQCGQYYTFYGVVFTPSRRTELSRYLRMLSTDTSFDLCDGINTTQIGQNMDIWASLFCISP